MRAFLRRLFLPPAAPRERTAEQVRTLALVRAGGTLLALLGNTSIFATMFAAGVGRPEVMRPAAAVNISLLALDLVITLALLRRPRRGYLALFYFCLALEVVSGVVWLQLTGTLSSYYLAAGLLLVPLYRLAAGYGAGLFLGAGTLLLHIGAFLLEEVGVLQPASLFTAELPGIYGEASTRWAAMGSMLWLYTVAFAGANYLAALLIDKDRAVDSANLARQRAVEGALHGRLSGARLADRYDIGELIGRGGMGEVYQARRIDDGRSVAIKVLHAHLEQSSEIRARFRREAELVGRLPAAHIAELYEFGTTDEGYDFLAMELLPGEDLAAVLRRRGRLGGDELADVVDGVAAGLEAAHAAGVVHRDLKPQNVILVPDGDGRARAKLVDFGIARLLEDSDGMTQTAAVLGTAGYMAPEQARGSHGDVGPHTDVFALGAIVYRALTSRPAFPSSNPIDAIDQVLHMHPPPPSALRPELPADVDCVLALALAKRTGDRYARAPELAADLRLALAGRLADKTRARAARLPPPVDLVGPTADASPRSPPAQPRR